MHESPNSLAEQHGSYDGGRGSACRAATVIAAAIAFAVGAAAAEEAPRAFVPGEISVGEPIVLPSAAAAAPPTVAAPAAAAAAAAVPGNGWIGLAVAESRTPGRWMVAEVVPESPAAVAGIRVGDEVRAVNGTILRTADDVAQSLTALAPGQAVSVAIAREEAIADVRMTAAPRPAPKSPREWQAAPSEPAAELPARFGPGPAAPVAAAQPPVALPPAPAASVMATPATTPSAAPSAFQAAPATGFSAAAPAPFPPAGTAGPSAPSAAGPGRGRTALGVRTVPIDPGMQSRFRLRAPHGAYVLGVVQDLPAARAGLPPGSVIVALDERPVGSPEELTRLVTSGPVGRPVALEYVLPGGEAKKAEVVLQPLEIPLERALVSPAPTAAPALLPSPAAGTAGEPLPYRSDRPVSAAALEAAREEIRRLRARIDALERSVGPAAGRPD
jgi:membrane-associated protease RseP (regulator of RpoE activity)